MNNEELRDYNKKRKIYQMAWVTRDLEKSMKAWVENLNIGPWTVLTFTDKSLKYLKVDDKNVTVPFKFLIALSWVGDMQLEIIQPVYGPTIYEAFIEKHGEGLHHVKEQIKDESIDAVLQEYCDKGIGVLQTGQFDIDVHYYLNTEPKLNFIYELDLPTRKGMSAPEFGRIPDLHTELLRFTWSNAVSPSAFPVCQSSIRRFRV
jgi:hypothetical protein